MSPPPSPPSSTPIHPPTSPPHPHPHPPTHPGTLRLGSRRTPGAASSAAAPGTSRVSAPTPHVPGPATTAPALSTTATSAPARCAIAAASPATAPPTAPTAKAVPRRRRPPCSAACAAGEPPAPWSARRSAEGARGNRGGLRPGVPGLRGPGSPPRGIACAGPGPPPTCRSPLPNLVPHTHAAAQVVHGDVHARRPGAGAVRAVRHAGTPVLRSAAAGGHAPVLLHVWSTYGTGVWCLCMWGLGRGGRGVVHARGPARRGDPASSWLCSVLPTRVPRGLLHAGRPSRGPVPGP